MNCKICNNRIIIGQSPTGKLIAVLKYCGLKRIPPNEFNLIIKFFDDKSK